MLAFPQIKKSMLWTVVVFLVIFIYTLHHANLSRPNLVNVLKAKLAEPLFVSDASKAKPEDLSPRASESKTCMPQHHVMYLKTHKTGSSTLSNMLYRYALRHNRTIVPVKDDPYPETLRMSDLDNSFNGLPKTGPFDILPEHLRFNKAAVSRVLHPDTVYATSLRHPIDHIRSYFKEYGLMHSYGPNRLQTFVNNPWQYNKNMRNLPSVNAHQLGLENKDKYDIDVIENLITDLDETFRVKIITEYFDESLVLLRRKLCWKVEDIIYMVLRKRHYSSEEIKASIFNGAALQNFYNYSIADFMLYDHFLKRFLRDLEFQSQDYWNEVSHYKSTLYLVATFCTRVKDFLVKNSAAIYDLAGDLQTGEGRLFLEIERSLWSSNFTVDAVDCALMMMRTRVLRNIVRVRNSPLFCSPKIYRKQTGIIHAACLPSHKVAILHSAYCEEYSSYYRLPMKVLATEHSYMWSNPGVI